MTRKALDQSSRYADLSRGRFPLATFSILLEGVDTTTLPEPNTQTLNWKASSGIKVMSYVLLYERPWSPGPSDVGRD